RLPNELPFPASQHVEITAVLGSAGALSAKVKYRLRGENELVLRVTFHQSPREKWKELAQLLSLTDGFRGQVTSVTASDTYATNASQYSANGSTITASRRIKFLLREVPITRAADYNAFLRAVQSDESQDFILERHETSPSKTNSATQNSTASPKTVPHKP